MAKKKSILLSKRSRSITSTIATRKATSLKPLRARQLIRRFHILLKNKSIILNKLNYTEDYYLKAIKETCKLSKQYESSKSVIIKELKINKTPSTQDFQLDGLSTVQLISKLGEIDGEIQKRGGLETYQSASTQGQDSKRGGDSSKKLVEWLKELKPYNTTTTKPTALEIGCLSSKNEISKCNIFKDVVKIDLHSQEPGTIIEQDFMDRAIPTSNDEKFNLISCSLVVNFVPNAEGRGDMLRHITEFFNTDSELCCLLFFVLPLPCVTNSRYCTNESFLEIMQQLGFTMLKNHESQKLAYWLFRYDRNTRNLKFKIRKKELESGSNRNNFCIVLD